MYILECKHWHRKVPKTIVHAMRNIVSDAGANVGLIVSSSGFQVGAAAASTHSNVQLLGWLEFQTMFEARWFEHYLIPTLAKATSTLIEYTEPFNSRVDRLASALSSERRWEFIQVQEKHRLAAFVALLVISKFDTATRLPLDSRFRHSANSEGELPDGVMKAGGWREFLAAFKPHARKAILELERLLEPSDA